MRAELDGVTVAEGETIVHRGVHFFDPDDVNWKAIRPSDRTRLSPLVGKAGFYHVVVGERMLTDAAMVYESPFNRARQLRNRVAFIKEVQLVG